MFSTPIMPARIIDASLSTNPHMTCTYKPQVSCSTIMNFIRFRAETNTPILEFDLVFVNQNIEIEIQKYK